MTPAELDGALASWLRYLRAERKSPHTLKTYSAAVRAYVRWCRTTGNDPEINKEQLIDFIEHMITNGGRSGKGCESTTIKTRYDIMRLFSAWLATEGIIDADELRTVRPPQVDEKVVPVLSLEQIHGLLKTCGSGARRSFTDIRDELIIRLMLETLARASEVADMDLEDVDIATESAIIRRGKGGRGRRVPLGPKTVVALDRYLRLRARHKLAGTRKLLLGDRNRSFGYPGLYQTLKGRANKAGFEFHPHMTRHTGADRWLEAGGSEGGLMAVGGWKRREMLDRYTRARSASRAVDEARRLNLGDF